MAARSNRRRINTGSIWEPLAGYSRAVRVENRILVSGTTATHGAGEVIAPDSPESQAVYVLDKIQASVEALGGAMEDIVRTRIYLRDQKDWEKISQVHGRYLGHVRPANTLVEVSSLIGNYVQAEAAVE
jgi:enamine deaminase RidA (YjgF/YER057c/UK114 family)